MNYASAILVWLVLMVLAILNGTFRVTVLKLRLSSNSAHVISSLLLIAIIQAVAYLYVGRNSFGNGQILLLGLVWVLLTPIFEFGYGHFVAGNSWQRPLADYNIFAGRIWVLVLLGILLRSPALGSKLAVTVMIR